jgi:hypothetical protein
MEARRFEKQARQGDTLLVRVNEIPAGAKLRPSTSTMHIVTHSTSGHHHAITAPIGDVEIYDVTPRLGYVRVKSQTPVALQHHRQSVPHEAIELRPGDICEVRRQREWTPFGDRRVED